MITIHDAIYSLNPSIVVIRGESAFDSNDQEISYDLNAAQAKLIKMQTLESESLQAQSNAKESALSKLTALGLTSDEINALIG